jgi:hypothetical protein
MPDETLSPEKAARYTGTCSSRGSNNRRGQPAHAYAYLIARVCLILIPRASMK